MMKKVQHIFLVLVISLSYLIVGCSNKNITTLTETPFPTNAFLSDKTDFELEITLDVFSDSAKAEDADINVWVSELINRLNLSIDTVIYELNPPKHICFDKENQNKILYWHFNLFADSIRIKRKIRGSSFTYTPEINSNIVSIKWSEIPDSIFIFYTKEEPFLEQTEKIKQLAKEIVGDEKNQYFRAKKIFEWVNENMTYIYPPENRGASFACETLKGDCGQYSNLLIALCRSIGIPARQQSGFTLKKDNIGSHVWSEIYFPFYGWIPVDATRKDGFCKISSDQIIASVGMNIPLPNTPEWANYENSEVENGRTDFMQTSTTAFRLRNIVISTEKKLLKLVMD